RQPIASGLANLTLEIRQVSLVRLDDRRHVGAPLVSVIDIASLVFSEAGCERPVPIAGRVVDTVFAQHGAILVAHALNCGSTGFMHPDVQQDAAEMSHSVPRRRAAAAGGTVTITAPPQLHPLCFLSFIIGLESTAFGRPPSSSGIRRWPRQVRQTQELGAVERGFPQREIAELPRWL